MNETDIDVAIVGGGIGGCIAAAQFRQLGVRLRVVDRFAAPRNEFRAEQLVGPQIGQLRRLGLLDSLTQNREPATATVNVRRGAVLDRTTIEQYGMSYQSMVAAVRKMLAPDTFVSERVAGIETSPGVQRLRLADGRRIDARLIVLATGLMPQLPRQLGMEWQMVSAGHSLCLGFDLELHDRDRAASVPLIYYGEGPRHRVDYIALFRIDATIRANLFCYLRRDDLWVFDAIDRPDECLAAVAPGLVQVIGPYNVAKPVECRSNDIKVAVDPVRDGVVLIGDAFQTPCPAAGTGIDRILSDVETLGRLLPHWLASSGMAADKITQFYGDPAKRALDAECIRIAMYRRDFSTRADLRWRAHRSRVLLQRRLKRSLADVARVLRGPGQRETAPPP